MKGRRDEERKGEEERTKEKEEKQRLKERKKRERELEAGNLKSQRCQDSLTGFVIEDSGREGLGSPFLSFPSLVYTIQTR